MKFLKHHKKKIIAWILVLGWLGVIFSFSNQTGVQSGELSNGLLTYLLHLFHLNIQPEVVSFVFRKLAHFTEYFILGILLLHLFSQYSISKRNKIIFTILLGASYAASDEFHQMFIAGRSPQIFDVFVDTCGVCTSCVLYWIIQKVKNRTKKS